MSNSFLFIIPLTPAPFLNTERLALRRICFGALSAQTYGNWKALVIGRLSEQETLPANFINLEFEGAKEEKLQKATEYVLSQTSGYDYLIRLDDDDVFNPRILASLATSEFDLCVDRHHSFWNAASGLTSQKVMYWFPNTCIHKSEHALKPFGSFPPGDYVRFRKQPVLIENEHNDFNRYYSQRHRIVYTEKNNPLYLRSLNPGSITALQSGNYTNYLNQHGYWKKNNFVAFGFLQDKLLNENKTSAVKQVFLFYFYNFISNLRALKNYNNVVVKK